MTKQMEAHENFQKLMRRLLGYGMQAYFLLLLALARSRTHLKELHDELVPENCRLLRDDFIILERAWGLRFSHDADPELNYVLDHNHAGWMLDCIREYSKGSGRGGAGYTDLTRYYFGRLEKIAQPLGMDLLHTHYPTVYPHPNSGRKPHFTARLCGRKMTCEIRLNVGAGVTIVRFEVWERDLTEPFTHQLMQLPPWKREGRMSSSDKGCLLDVNYVLKGVSVEGVEKTLQHPIDNAPMLITDQAFLDQITARLQTLGVPVEHLMPVLEYKDDKPGDWINWNDWERYMVVAGFSDVAPRRIEGLTAKLNETGFITLHLAVRKGLAPEETVRLVRVYLEEKNPRLQPEDLVLDRLAPSTRDDLALMPVALYFVSEESVCKGAPHPAIPRDDHGKLVWPQSR